MQSVLWEKQLGCPGKWESGVIRMMRMMTMAHRINVASLDKGDRRAFQIEGAVLTEVFGGGKLVAE